MSLTASISTDQCVDNSRLLCRFAKDQVDLIAAKKLRYLVYVEEMNNQELYSADKIEEDEYDPFCQHLMVVDSQSNQVAAYSRLLDSRQVARIGSFKAEKEFQADWLHQMDGIVLEIGRTCVHPNYRHGGAISLLWSTLISYIKEQKISYLIGLTSVPLPLLPYGIEIITEELLTQCPSISDRKAKPLAEIPDELKIKTAELPDAQRWQAIEEGIPSLLRTYLRLGAKICGYPCWDPQMKLADFFTILTVAEMDPKFVQFFAKKGNQA